MGRRWEAKRAEGGRVCGLEEGEERQHVVGVSWVRIAGCEGGRSGYDGWDW